jgi:exodeoxyribonuclease-5
MDATPITLYPEQQAAKEAVLKWFGNTMLTETLEQPIFRIFGYAGTGKSYVTKETVREIEGKILYAAYTGKAALVMNRHGVPATTIHKLIYSPIIPDRNVHNELKRQLHEATESGDKEAMRIASESIRSNQSLKFELNDESPLEDAALLVLDECMMVNDEMMNDLLSFGVPILVLGDPGQLPPISGTGALVHDKPDVLFTEIHRQALDNPIINLSFKARKGMNIPRGEYGNSSHIFVGDLKSEKVLTFDQILVGKNTTRRNWNRRLRGLLGFEGHYPVVGDKLICLRNKPALGLFNGLLVTVKKIIEEYDTTIELMVETETGNEVMVQALKAHFDEYYTPGILKTLQWWDFQNAEEFDFGYAITVHKAQGSQWDHVGFYDDKFLSWKKPERYKWLYTGITRASETVTIMS